MSWRPVPVTINRDPFARADLKRLTVPEDDRTPCRWCGQPGARFAYYWQPDDKLREFVPDGRCFCAVDCWRAFQ